MQLQQHVAADQQPLAEDQNEGEQVER
jgi:hypothetical protein